VKELIKSSYESRDKDYSSRPPQFSHLAMLEQALYPANDDDPPTLTNNWLNFAACQFDALPLSAQKEWMNPSIRHRFRGKPNDRLDRCTLTINSNSNSNSNGHTTISPPSLSSSSSSSTSTSTPSPKATMVVTPTATASVSWPLTAMDQANAIRFWWDTSSNVDSIRVIEVLIQMSFIELLAAWIRISSRWFDDWEIGGHGADHNHPIRFGYEPTLRSIQWYLPRHYECNDEKDNPNNDDSVVFLKSDYTGYVYLDTETVWPSTSRVYKSYQPTLAQLSLLPPPGLSDHNTIILSLTRSLSLPLALT
jgi:hypothetical protein